MPTARHHAFLILALAISLTSGCRSSGGSSGDDLAADFEELDISICAPEGGPFTLAIDNPYFPLPVGREWVLEGDDDGVLVRVEITVLDDTEEVDGVETRVVEEAEYEDGEIVEISRNFFVQAPDRTVCYYGEDVDIYEDGMVVRHDGEWRAGDGENRAGIQMPGVLMEETKFFQESAPGIARDRSAIIGVEDSIRVPAGEFLGALHVIDWDPLEGETSGDAEDKYYAPGVGLIVDDVVELVSVSL